MKTYYDFFKELSLIPRESGKEEKIQQFLLNFAKEHGLHAFREDVSGNIVIQKLQARGMNIFPVSFYKDIWIWYVKKHRILHIILIPMELS